MSETVTHTRGETNAHPITGEPPGIAEILERRVAETETGTAPPADRPQEDDATRTATELADWQRRARESDARANEADRARQIADARAAQVQQGAEDTGFTSIVTALGAAQGEVESLKTELKTAGEGGDFSRMADIQVRLGQLGAEVRDLERGKGEFERAREARLRAPPQRQQPAADSASERAILQRLGAGSREQFLSTRTPATAEFLRANPQFFTDEAAFARISGADSLATGRNIAKDTPEYFDLIRKEAGMTQPTSSPTHRAAERSASPSAAPARDAPGPSGNRIAGWRRLCDRGSEARGRMDGR